MAELIEVIESIIPDPNLPANFRINRGNGQSTLPHSVLSLFLI
jgi:hypothetical protein